MSRRGACLVLLMGVVPAGTLRADAAAYAAANAAYAAANYAEAIKQAEAAVAADPSLWQAWQVDGNARIALGDKAGAIAVYRYALQGNPDNPQLKAYVDQLAGAPAPAPAAAQPAAVAEPSIAPEPRPWWKRFSVALGGGWGQVAMGDINGDLTTIQQIAQFNPGNTGVSVTKVTSGFGGQVEVDYDLIELVQLVLVGGYVVTNASAVDYTVHDDSSAPFLTMDEIYSAKGAFSVLPVMVGGRFVHPLAPRWIFRAGLQAGVGLAKGTSSDTDITTYSGSVAYLFPNTHTRSKSVFDGTGPAVVTMVGASFEVNPHLLVALDAGFRYIKMDLFVTEDDDTDGDGVYETHYNRELMKHPDNSPYTLDFSGALLNLSAIYRF